jgi:hypothetical protein
MSAPARHTRTAWLALGAMLFLTLSSTLAVLQSHGRYDLFADICSTAGIKHVSAAGESSGGGSGKSGDVHCAQCLNSTSAPAIEPSPMVALFALVAGTQAMPAPDAAAARPAPRLLPHSHGPPRF